jgi:hypothetical protein
MRTISTLSALIAKANTYRKNIALDVINALEFGRTPDLTALKQPASHPVALGFSDSDLAYWRDSFASHMSEYEDLRSRAMAFVVKINVKASRDNGHMSNEDRDRREVAYHDATWAGRRIRAINAFAAIVADIVNERKIAAEIAARSVAPTTAVIEPVDVPTYKAPTFKVKARHTHKVHIARPAGIRLTSLAELADISTIRENSAMLTA